LKKLSIAVMVDGKPIRETGADGETINKTEAWSAEKLKEFESIISSAVALDRKRGDTLEIKTMEFTREDLDSAQKLLESAERSRLIRQITPYLGVGFLFMAFFWFVVRPYIKWVTENTIDSVDTFLPQTIEELEKLQKMNAAGGVEDVVPVMPNQIDPEKVEGEMMRDKLMNMVDGNPHKAALIVRDWLTRSDLSTRGIGADKEDGPSKTA
jgi:flagellar M-ring protein FliF